MLTEIIEYYDKLATQLKRHNTYSAFRTLREDPTYETLLHNSLANVTIQVKVRLPWVSHLTPARQGVLVDLAMSHGLEDLCNKHQLLYYIREGLYLDATVELLREDFAKTEPHRAITLVKVLLTGEFRSDHEL